MLDREFFKAACAAYAKMVVNLQARYVGDIATRAYIPLGAKELVAMLRAEEDELVRAGVSITEEAPLSGMGVTVKSIAALEELVNRELLPAYELLDAFVREMVVTLNFGCFLDAHPRPDGVWEWIDSIERFMGQGDTPMVPERTRGALQETFDEHLRFITQ